MISRERPSDSTSVWRTRSTASASCFRSPSKAKMTVMVLGASLISSIRAPAARMRVSTSPRCRCIRRSRSGSCSVDSLSFTCITYVSSPPR